MDIRLKMREGFRDLQGGLFGKVEKADVGGAAEEVQRAGGDMLGWADPFMPDDCMPAAVKAIAIDRIEKGLSAHYTHPWATRSSRRPSPASSRGRTASPSCRSAISSSPRDRIPACCLR